MEIKRHGQEAIDILELSGTFTAGDDAARLRDELARAMGPGSPILILDLSAVDRLEAELLGELLEARRRVRTAGGVLKLVASRDGCACLREAGFAGPSETYERRDQAVESFAPETMTAGIP